MIDEKFLTEDVPAQVMMLVPDWQNLIFNWDSSNPSLKDYVSLMKANSIKFKSLEEDTIYYSLLKKTCELALEGNLHIEDFTSERAINYIHESKHYISNNLKMLKKRKDGKE